MTGALGWRSIFLLNLPVAAVMLGLAPALLAESRDRATERDLDATGALTITGAVALLVLAFVRVPQVGWLSASTVVTLLGAAGLGAAFVLAERRKRAPLVPLRADLRSAPGGTVSQDDRLMQRHQVASDAQNARMTEWRRWPCGAADHRGDTVQPPSTTIPWPVT